MDAGYKRAVKWITSREKYNFYVEDDDSEEYDFPDIDEPMLLSDIFAARASGDLDNFERALNWCKAKKMPHKDRPFYVKASIDAAKASFTKFVVTIMPLHLPKRPQTLV